MEKTKEMQIVEYVQKIIFGLNKENIYQSAQSLIAVFDYDFPCSFNMLISQFISSCIIIPESDFDIYLNFMKEIEKFQETNKIKPQIFEVFTGFHSSYYEEANYPILKMYEQNLIDLKIIKDRLNPYFAHYMSQEEIQKEMNDSFYTIFKYYEKLSKNDWELHKKYIEEGHSPKEIAKIIRNDEIEKLQEISSQTNFDFNQTIKPSIYERCSFINQENVSLIDYAAFFGSVKCFKYLLMNNSKVKKTGKYAVAGGNEEIIHLCEQNHSSFKKAYQAAIAFHRNNIFYYLYDNKLDDIKNKQNLDLLSIFWNTEIFTFLQENGLKIKKYIILEIARTGNLYLVKHFLKENLVPKDILPFATDSGNNELVKYVLEQEGININAEDIYLFYLNFILIPFYFKIIFGN